MEVENKLEDFIIKNQKYFPYDYTNILLIVAFVTVLLCIGAILYYRNQLLNTEKTKET